MEANYKNFGRLYSSSMKQQGEVALSDIHHGSQRQCYIQKQIAQNLLANQTEKLIMYYKKLSQHCQSNCFTFWAVKQNSGMNLLEMYQQFYSSLFSQIQCYLPTYEKELRNNHIKPQIILVSLMSHFKKAAEFISSQLVKTSNKFNMCFDFNAHKLKTSFFGVENKHLCNHCDRMIISKNIQLEKVRIQHAQFNDPYNYYAEGFMKFQEDVQSDKDIQPECLDNEKQVYAHIHIIKQRIQNRANQIADFLNQLQKYSNSKYVFGGITQPKNQEQNTTFDTCYKSVIQIVEQKIIQVIRKLEVQRTTNPSKKSVYCQFGASIDQFLQLQQQKQKLKKENQSRQQQIQRLRNFIQALQKKTQKSFIQNQVAKYKMKQNYEQINKLRNELELQRSQHRLSIRRLQQRQSQSESLYYQLKTLKQQLATLQASKQNNQGLQKRNETKRKNSKKNTIFGEQSKKSPDFQTKPRNNVGNKQAKQTVDTINVSDVAIQQNLFQSLKDHAASKVNQRLSSKINKFEKTDTAAKMEKKRNFTLIQKRQQQNHFSFNQKQEGITKNQKKLKQEQIKNSQDMFHELENGSAFNASQVDEILLGQDEEVLNEKLVNINKCKDRYRQSKVQQSKDQIQIDDENKIIIQRLSMPVILKQIVNKKQNLKVLQNVKTVDLNQRNNQKFRYPQMDSGKDIMFKLIKQSKIKDKQFYPNKSLFRLYSNRLTPPKTMRLRDNSSLAQLQKRQFINTLPQKIEFKNILSQTILKKGRTTNPNHMFQQSLNFSIKTTENDSSSIQMSNIFGLEDVDNLYLCIQGAIQHEKSKKTSKQTNIQLLKTQQFKYITRVLALVAGIHVRNNMHYQAIKNLLLFPFQTIVSQQNFIVIKNSQYNENKIRDSLIKIIVLHRNCPPNKKKFCQHLAKFIRRLQEMSKQNQHQIHQETYGATDQLKKTA